MNQRRTGVILPVSNGGITTILVVSAVALYLCYSLLSYVSYWVFYIISMLGGLALLIFLIRDAIKNRHALSIPCGLILLAYSFFAAPIYLFLYCYSGNYTDTKVIGTQNMTAQILNDKVYFYAGLIAFGVLCVVALVMIFARKLQATAFSLVSIVICAAIICSVAFPAYRTISIANPVKYNQLTQSEKAENYVVITPTKLFLGVQVTESRIGRLHAGKLILFPGTMVEPMPIPVKTLPVGTKLIARGWTSDGWIEVGIDENSFGYVRLKDISLNAEMAKK